MRVHVEGLGGKHPVISEECLELRVFESLRCLMYGRIVAFSSRLLSSALIAALLFSVSLILASSLFVLLTSMCKIAADVMYISLYVPKCSIALPYSRLCKEVLSFFHVVKGMCVCVPSALYFILTLIHQAAFETFKMSGKSVIIFLVSSSI